YRACSFFSANNLSEYDGGGRLEVYRHISHPITIAPLLYSSNESSPSNIARAFFKDALALESQHGFGGKRLP
ncbi:MAG TPA: hypothetical protein VFV38_00740, partial [Ktedonobacteraceae bacterium]|nr:hypothetical protein [Ktedonobacteraceae bacterium]